MKNILCRSFAVLFVVLLSFSTLSIFNVKGQTRTITVPDDYSTIQEAIEAASDGDTIFVKRGTYQEKTITKNKKIG